MDYLLKVLFSIAITMIFVQLGLTIAVNWDKESRNSQKAKQCCKNIRCFYIRSNRIVLSCVNS